MSIGVLAFLPPLRSDSRVHISRLSREFISEEMPLSQKAFLVCLILLLYLRLATKYSSFARVSKGCLFKKLPALRTLFLSDSQSGLYQDCFFRLLLLFSPMFEITQDFSCSILKRDKTSDVCWLTPFLLGG